MAMSARTKARDDLKEYLDFIQSYVGTLCAMTPGMNLTHQETIDYITPWEREED